MGMISFQESLRRNRTVVFLLPFLDQDPRITHSISYPSVFPWHEPLLGCIKIAKQKPIDISLTNRNHSTYILCLLYEMYNINIYIYSARFAKSSFHCVTSPTKIHNFPTHDCSAIHCQITSFHVYIQNPHLHQDFLYTFSKFQVWHFWPSRLLPQHPHAGASTAGCIMGASSHFLAIKRTNAPSENGLSNGLSNGFWTWTLNLW